MKVRTHLQARLRDSGPGPEMLRFALVGSVATAADVTVTLLLFAQTSFNLPENLISTVAFLCAFAISYLGHRHYTFRRSGSLSAFLALALGMLVLRNALLYLMLRCWQRGLPPLLVAMLSVTALTYLISKFCIFREHRLSSEEIYEQDRVGN